MRSARSVNHRFPSAPAAIEDGSAAGCRPAVYDDTTPSVVIAPIPVAKSFSPIVTMAVNHSRPSGPAAIASSTMTPPVSNSVTVPSGVILATALFDGSTNHMLPSGPAVMPTGSLPGVMPAENSVTAPSGVTRPTFAALCAVYQTFPAASVAIRVGWLTPLV